MVNRERFIKGIKYLSVYYTNFKFDITDDFSLDVWHNAFKDITDEDFKYCVETYCKLNQYAPSSPHALLDIYFDYVTDELTSDQAWELVEKNLNKGISGYQTISNGKVVYVNKFYEEIKKYPLIEETCKELESTLRDITSDNKSYTKHEFKELYKSKLERKTNKMALSGTTQFKIGE